MGVAGAAAWALHAAGLAQLRAPYSYDRRTTAVLRLPSFNGQSITFNANVTGDWRLGRFRNVVARATIPFVRLRHRHCLCHMWGHGLDKDRAATSRGKMHVTVSPRCVRGNRAK
jgi:hypothetical protein